MIPAVEYDNLEPWLRAYLTPLLTDWAATVDRRFPGKSWVPGFWVVVRDDSGSDLSVVTASRRVGFTVVGPESDYAGTSRLAQRVAYLLRTSPSPGPSTPVVACIVRGPYSLDATGRTEFYLSGDLIVAGHQ